MVINNIDSVNNTCSEYVSSGQFFSYVVRYNGDEDLFGDIFGDDICVNTLNGQFAVIYKPFTADVSTSAGFEKAVRPGYRFVPKCYGLMGISALEKSGVPAIRNLPGLSLTGNGTLIGFIDTGIDYTQNMFRRSDGSTRVKYIWDQAAVSKAARKKEMTDGLEMGTGNGTLNGSEMGTGNGTLNGSEMGTEKETTSGIGHFGLGRVYDENEINAALNGTASPEDIPPGDENGHGTFLASVAGGSDESVGIAPDCNIVMVKVRQAQKRLRDFYIIPEDKFCCSEDDIMLAVRFLLETAIREGKPLVMCLGLGTNLGSHEGRSILERYLNLISSHRGICVVTSIGNELGYGHHFQGEAVVSGETRTQLVDISVGKLKKGFSMEIWASTPAFLMVKVISPTGEVFDDIKFYRDSYASGNFLFEGTKIDVVNVALDSNTGAQMIFIRLTNPVEGVWKLEVSETAGINGLGFDSWLPISNFVGNELKFLESALDVTICSPGCARGVITVTAYDVRNDAIYRTASRGFNRMGFIKPDFAASGVEVNGSFAGSGASKSGEDLLTEKSGSSVSAAVVSGMVAMILEWAIVRGNKPFETTEEVRQLLVRGAKRPNELTYPNPVWGWGTVDLFASFASIRL